MYIYFEESPVVKKEETIKSAYFIFSCQEGGEERGIRV